MENCYFTEKECVVQRNPQEAGGTSLYESKVCGRYKILDNCIKSFDRNKTSSYLFYNKVLLDDKHYNFLLTEEVAKGWEANNKLNEEIMVVTPEMINNWFPKNFYEKVDLILLKLYQMQKFLGNYVFVENLKELFFIVSNNENDISKEIQFFNKFLTTESNYLLFDGAGGHNFSLSPKGLEKVYELQKYQSSNKNVFIAMKFGKETVKLREKIKEGLVNYNVRIMDEIEHNHQIVPEMLYEIRNCKFIIAELSHHNNGAYYEAGYALGIGKEVIHICSEEELKSNLHFDVAQINTIIYKDINEIPEKLKKRIKATIG